MQLIRKLTLFSCVRTNQVSAAGGVGRANIRCIQERRRVRAFG